MRSNAARLLRDVQVMHSAMLAQIDRIDPEGARAADVAAAAHRPGAGGGTAGGARRGAADRGRGSRRGPGRGGDELDVPEFIPHSG
jgi:hypothetical protein